MLDGLGGLILGRLPRSEADSGDLVAGGERERLAIWVLGGYYFTSKLKFLLVSSRIEGRQTYLVFLISAIVRFSVWVR